MARETIYVVQTYAAGKRSRIKPDVPISCKSAEDAVRKAERLGLTKLGAVALSSSADVELGEYDEEPDVLFRTGELRRWASPPPMAPELCRPDGSCAPQRVGSRNPRSS